MAKKEMTLREFCERYRNGDFLGEDFYQCKKYSNVMGTPNGVPIAFLLPDASNVLQILCLM